MSIPLFFRPLAVGLVFLITSPLFGITIDIKNAGFESPAVAGGFDVDNATDWETPTVTTGVLGSPGQFEAAPPEGTQVGFMSSNTPTRFMSQGLFAGVDPILIAADQQYSFSMMLGRRNLSSASGNPYELFVAIRPIGDDASDIAGATASTSLLVDDAFTAKGSFAQANFTLLTGANPVGLGQQVELVLLKNSGGQSLVDSISGSVVAVPEPASVVLFGIALGAIGLVARRRS